eukprot:744556-Amphidinium_carterae.1
MQATSPRGTRHPRALEEFTASAFSLQGESLKQVEEEFPEELDALRRKAGSEVQHICMLDCHDSSAGRHASILL